MNGLSVRDVVVRYRDDGGTTTAVDGVSLDIAPGEVVALLGPSGCGKSSLLRGIAGLEPLAAGEVRWDGADLAGVPVHRRGFGLLFQDGQLFPHRDVAGNVAFGLEMARVPAPERRRRVAELLTLVGLQGYDARPIATLSGGERQRVALARSLAPSPRLLLLDEPLSALDRELRERLAEDLRRVLRDTGTTALFVTHDHDEAFTVADRVAVMDAGRLLQVAEPAELWRRPASRRVAEFLGYQVFVPVTVVTGVVRGGALDGVVLEHPGAAESGPPPTTERAVQELVALGDGSLRVVDGAGDGRSGAGPTRGPDLIASVQSVVYRRGRAQVTVQVPGLGALAAWADGRAPEPGVEVAVRVDPQAVARLPV